MYRFLMFSVSFFRFFLTGPTPLQRTLETPAEACEKKFLHALISAKPRKGPNVTSLPLSRRYYNKDSRSTRATQQQMSQKYTPSRRLQKVVKLIDSKRRKIN